MRSEIWRDDKNMKKTKRTQAQMMSVEERWPPAVPTRIHNELHPSISNAPGSPSQPRYFIQEPSPKVYRYTGVRAGKKDDPSNQGPGFITMLSSFVHRSEHQPFFGMVCGYLGFEGMTERFLKKRKIKEPHPCSDDGRWELQNLKPRHREPAWT